MPGVGATCWSCGMDLCRFEGSELWLRSVRAWDEAKARVVEHREVCPVLAARRALAEGES